MMGTQVQGNSLRLKTLLPELRLPQKVAAISVGGVALDSRKLQQGELFFALVGTRVDGTRFIESAIERGACAVLVESTPQCRPGTVRYVNSVAVVAVAHLAERVGAIAAQCYGDPSTELEVFGVTGTNGKSTCVSLMAQLCEFLGKPSASIGTLGINVAGESRHDVGMTTPDPVSCQQFLAELLQDGVKSVAMEVSSHGLAQNRVTGIKFKAAVFTNIGHDHLDYHSSLDHYVAAKLKLFKSMGLQKAVVNLDDPYSSQVLQAAKKQAKVLGYSLLHFAADVFASEIQFNANGLQFLLRTPWGEAWVQSPLLGEFNVYNLIAAIAAVCESQADFAKVVACACQLKAVTGRMQNIPSTADIGVIIDYAHTPDALAQAIAAARSHTAGKLWVLFGCGGDRDRSKRSLMAQVAEKFADRIVVTSDNPRSEDPQEIIEHIRAGFSVKTPYVEVDRRKAIEFVISEAGAGDTVLLAGKGHESYQIVGEQKLPLDEAFIARQALATRERRAATPGGSS